MWLLACVSAPGLVLDSPADSSDGPAPDGAPEPLPGGDTDDADPTEAVFDPTRIHDVRIRLADEAWADIRDNPWAETWWTGEVHIDEDAPLGEVGIRAFGAGSMVAGKPSLKLSFDHVLPGRDWRGLEQLKLDNSSQDVGFHDEYVCTRILREAGVPAARTGWARVSVNDAPVGFFVLLEAIDDRFLERWFGNDDGPLYGMISGRWGQGLNPMDAPLDWYEIQTSVPGDGSELVAAAARLAVDDDPGALVDLDGFFAESVLRSALGSLDAFSADGNNFYLYVDAGIIRVIPWDFDYDLGTSGVAYGLTVDPRAPWNQSPWSYNAVTGADYVDPVLLASLARGADPEALLAAHRDGALDWEALDAAIVASRELIRPEVEADVLGYGAAFPVRVADVRLFLHSRLSGLFGEEVADCPEADGTPLSAMAPTGSVGWDVMGVDGTTWWGPGFVVAGEHHCRGLFAHAPSEIEIQVPEGATRLAASVGLHDWNQVCGDGARFVVEQAGVELWQSPALGTYDAAVGFEVEVAPGALILRTTPESEYSCDTTTWLDVTAR